jgi:hypothetical protein
LKITIAEKLRPFSHLPGACCMIPWSSWKVQAYPALLKFENLMTSETQEHPLHWKGPVIDFTMELDLEKGCVWVYGKTAEGYRRVRIEMTDAGIEISFDKEKKKTVLPGHRITSHPLERLSLGSSKALDWELVRRRSDMAEILSVWFRLGQMIPHAGEKVGAAAFLKECEKTEVVSTYLKPFLAGFEGILSPRLADTDLQGIIPEGPFSSIPLIMLSEGARRIRSLFFTEGANEWNFLPCLAPQFHAGRFTGLRTEAGDLIDFEWSKKQLKRVVIHPAVSRQVFIRLPKPLISCRAGKKRHSLDQPLDLISDKPLFLDRFEK